MPKYLNLAFMLMGHPFTFVKGVKVSKSLFLEYILSLRVSISVVHTLPKGPHLKWTFVNEDACLYFREDLQITVAHQVVFYISKAHYDGINQPFLCTDNYLSTYCMWTNMHYIMCNCKLIKASCSCFCLILLSTVIFSMISIMTRLFEMFSTEPLFSLNPLRGDYIVVWVVLHKKDIMADGKAHHMAYLKLILIHLILL